MRSLILIPALALMAGAALAQEAPKAEDGPGPNMVIEVAAADGTLLGHDVPQGCFGYPRQVHSRQSRRQTPGAVLRRLLLVLIDATRDRVR